MDVQLAVNQTGNPLVQIAQNIELRTSAGIYFIFTPLTNPPGSIDDVDSSQEAQSIPPLDVGGAGGLSPLENEFNFSLSSLQPNTFYRVWMISLDLNAASGDFEDRLNLGAGDCPINISDPEARSTTICFGPNDGVGGQTLICPDAIPYVCCPGIGSCS